MNADLSAAVRFFSNACSYVQNAGLLGEIAWQRKAIFTEFTEGELLREHAWVTLCSGFRESTVRRVFDRVSLCFCDWESAEAIVLAGEICCSTATSAFANRRKMRGIFSTAKHIHDVGFGQFKQSVLANPIESLQALPFIGPITSWHLAKNLGLDVAKPDRHLARVSASLGFGSPDHFCRELAITTGEQAKVIDLIVWRYIADNPKQFRTSFA